MSQPTAPPPTLSQTETFDSPKVLTIAGGHFVHDTYSGFIAPLLPLIIEKLSLSLTITGSLVALTQIPALLSPFIGYLADKVSLRYFVILAPAITATLTSALGLTNNLITLAILLFATGVSVACFHAPAPAMVARMSGAKVGKGMSYFMAAGELGRSLAPLMVAAAVTLWTLDGLFRVVIFGWLASIILYFRLRNIPARPSNKPNVKAMLPAGRKLFAPLFSIILPRAFMLTALAIYLPTFMVQQGVSFQLASASLAIWELAGVAGALAGGTFSDRWGRKRVLLGAIISASFLMFAFLYAQSWLIIILLIALGLTALSTTPIMLALVQEQLPDNRAMANGIFITMSFLVRPIAAFSIGALGDSFGLFTAFLLSAFISLLAIPGIFFLPKNPEIRD